MLKRVISGEDEKKELSQAGEPEAGGRAQSLSCARAIPNKPCQPCDDKDVKLRQKLETWYAWSRETRQTTGQIFFPSRRLQDM